MASRFEIEIFTRFREQGISDIGRRVRAELRAIAADRSLSPQQQASRVGETRLGAERAISALQGSALRGLTPGSAEYARVSAQFAAARAALTRVFNEIERGSTDLGRRLQAILRRAGINLPTREVIAAARQAPFGPQAGAQAQSAAERARINASAQAVLAADREYITAQAAAARSRAQIAAEVQAILAADRAYISAQAATARAKAQISAGVQAELATDRQYINAQVSATRSKAQQQSAIQQQLAVDREYIATQISIARAKARQQAATQSALAADRTYTEAQISVARAKIRQQAAIQAALATDRAYLAAQTSVSRSKAQQQAETARALAADAQYTAAQVATSRAKAQQQAQYQRMLAADQEYISAQAQAAVAKRQVRAAIAREVSAITGSTQVEEQAVAALRQRIAADRQAAAAARLMANTQSAIGQQAVQAAYQRRIAEARVNAALHQQERAYVRAAVAAGEGSRFQRLLARYQFGGQARLPQELPTFGQFVGSRAATTIGYGISGALLYGSLRALGQMVKEAEELERVMNQVRRQFEEVGDTQNFGRAREGILGIARETGIDAEKVAESFRLLRGAYADTQEAQGATAVALRETRSAMAITAVTGLDLKETFDSLTATSLSFGVTMESIGDKALGLSERFGVPAREIIQFTADLAPVASELGFTADELAAVGAAMQRVSGRSGAALGEAVGRILPQIQNVKTEILDLYSTVPALGGTQGAGFQTILQGFAEGNVRDVFFQLIRDYGSLNKAQQAYVLELLGGRRETQALAAVLRNSGALIRELDADLTDAGRDTGKLRNYFNDLTDTVQNTRARMSEAFRQMGDALFRAGLAEVLITAAGAATVLAAALQLVFRPLAALNEVTGGYIGKLASWLLVSAALSKVMQVISVAITRKVTATAADTVATTANAGATAAGTVADVANTAATTAQTGATYRNVAAFEAEIAVLGANAAAQGANTAARGVNAASSLFGAGGRLAGLSPFAAIALPVVAGGIVYNQSQKQRKGVQGSEQALIDKLMGASDAQLAEIANSTTGLLDKAAIKFFKADLPEELARKVQVIRATQPSADDIRALLSGDKIGELVNSLNEDQLELLDLVFVANGRDDPEFNAANLTKQKIDQFLTQALQGDPFAANIIRLLADFAKDNPALQAMLDKAIADLSAATEGKDAGGFGVASQQKLDTARRLYEAGKLSAVDYQARLKGSIDNLKALQASSGVGGIGFTPKDAEQLIDQEEEMRKLLLSRVQNQLGAAERLRQLTGRDSAEATFNDLQNAIGSASGLDLRSRLELLPDAMTALQEAFQEELDAISDPIERYARAKEGFEIPDVIRELAVIQQINLNPQIEQFVRAAAAFLGIGLDQMNAELAAALIATRGNVAEAARRIFDAQINKLRSELADTTGLHIANDTDRQDYLKEIARVEAERDAALGRLGEQPNIEVPDYRGYLNDMREQQLADQANQERERAFDEAQRAAEEAARARIDLLKAQASKDPVRLAELEIEAANLAAAQAKSEADAIQAEAQRINAIRELEDARLDLFASLQEYYIAIAQAAGDGVRASELELGVVRERLRVLTEQGFGDTAEANRLRAQIVASEAAVRDAKFQDQLGDIDYLLEIEKITVGQAIEMLRAMQQIPTNTEEMNRELERRIRSLMNDLSQDFQFNLPTDLKLPTLYEVRRLAQTAQGQSYQDNRQINISFQANNVADAQAIAQGIADQFAAPSRFGTLPKRY